MALLGLVLGACAASPAPTIPMEPTGPLMSGAPQTATDETALFRLTLTADQRRYRAGQEITVTATLAYLGQDAELTASGSGGLVGFGVASAPAGIDIQPLFTSDCVRYTLTPAHPATYRFSKSGSGVAPNDPLASFMAAYFSSPDLRLPAGTWTISAQATIYATPDCSGGRSDLSSSLTVAIEP